MKGPLSQPIIFPDVELWLTGYLRNALAARGRVDVFVSNRRGSQDVAVWIRRDGGPVLDEVREAARVGINVFAKGATDTQVSELSSLVAALIRTCADGEPVCRVTQTLGPSPVPDALPRRYMSFELIVRGEELPA